MFATRLQFDVLFELKRLSNNDNLTLDDARKLDNDILIQFFNKVVHYSIKGCFCYHPYKDVKCCSIVVYNPIGFAWTWFDDIFNVATASRRITDLFKEVMEQYWIIDKWEETDLSPINKKGDDLCFITSLMELEKYAKFDMEKIYQSGVMNEKVFANIFNKNNKFYRIKNKVILQVYTYDELYNYLKDKFDDCILIENNMINIDHVSNNDRCIGIIVSDTFENLKTVDDILKEYDWEKASIGQVEQLMYHYDLDIILKYCNKFLDTTIGNKTSAKLIVEKAERNDFTDSQMKKWIKNFFQDFVSERYELEYYMKRMKNTESKEKMKKIYLNYLTAYL